MIFVGLTAEGDDAKANTEAFINKFGISWPTGYGARATIDAFGVTGYPTLFVIGADGNVAWNDWMEGELHDEIDKALQAIGT